MYICIHVHSYIMWYFYYISFCQYWEHRHQQLILVRDQLNSVEVLRILNGLEHARSTYADVFIDVHRDMGKVGAG